MKFIYCLISLLALSACGSSDSAKKDKLIIENGVREEFSDKSYTHYCAACHQKNGRGIKGLYPPLFNNENIMDLEYLISVVLNGTSGKINVEGEFYNGVMPDYGNITEEEMVELVNYLYSKIENNTDVTSADHIKSVMQRKR